MMLHIMPNRKLLINSFQMAYNTAVCTVGTLNSTKIDLGGYTMATFPLQISIKPEIFVNTFL